jgi:hypothetical protein
MLVKENRERYYQENVAKIAMNGANVNKWTMDIPKILEYDIPVP